MSPITIARRFVKYSDTAACTARPTTNSPMECVPKASTPKRSDLSYITLSATELVAKTRPSRRAKRASTTFVEVRYFPSSFVDMLRSR